ncbi:MAG: iron-containing alcohol dehydrogenase [Akkermansia sp.]|nr:iron-containing alcohol dehydrogenase [Akkermansia sp.]
MLAFEYHNPTRYVFGEGEHRNIGSLLRAFTNRVLLHYGGGSIKRSGVYNTIARSLEEAGISYCELGGVKPNPSVDLVRTGIELCRAENIRFVLAVGGGSVIDSAKAIALGVPHSGDIWNLYTREEELKTPPLPVACVLTLPAAGSENSPNTVLTNEESTRKLGYGHPALRPVLSIVDPTLFLTLPPNQMANGAADMLCHVFERYFTNTQDTELSDALCEATMRTIMQQAVLLKDEPGNVKAWGQLALSGTIAHNNLLGVGREQSWACHALEHELSAVYDVPHGAGLAVIVPAYLEAMVPHNPGIFAQWATNVMGVSPNRNTAEVIREGLHRLRTWYRELGLPQNMQELGIPAEADFAGMARAACVLKGGKESPHLPGIYAVTPDECERIYRACIRV